MSEPFLLSVSQHRPRGRARTRHDLPAPPTGTDPRSGHHRSHDEISRSELADFPARELNGEGVIDMAATARAPERRRVQGRGPACSGPVQRSPGLSSRGVPMGGYRTEPTLRLEVKPTTIARTWSSRRCSSRSSGSRPRRSRGTSTRRSGRPVAGTTCEARRRSVRARPGPGGCPFRRGSPTVPQAANSHAERRREGGRVDGPSSHSEHGRRAADEVRPGVQGGGRAGDAARPWKRWPAGDVPGGGRGSGIRRAR